MGIVAAMDSVGRSISPLFCELLFYMLIELSGMVSYIKILVVRLSVCLCDGCGRDCNEFAGRVQNHHVRFSFHKNGHINSFLR